MRRPVLRFLLCGFNSGFTCVRSEEYLNPTRMAYVHVTLGQQGDCGYFLRVLVVRHAFSGAGRTFPSPFGPSFGHLCRPEQRYRASCSLTMGCGASTGQAQPRMPLKPSKVMPSFDELLVQRQREVISDGVDPRFRVKGATLRACRRSELLCSELTASSLEVEDDDDSKPVWSSMDSSTWVTQFAEGVPLPPNRRTLERHLTVLDQFRQEVEGASVEFAEIVESRR